MIDEIAGVSVANPVAFRNIFDRYIKAYFMDFDQGFKKEVLKGRKLNNVTMTTEIERKERMPAIEKSP